MSQHLKTEANCSLPRTGVPLLLKSIPSLLSHHPYGCSQPIYLFCRPTRCTALLQVQWRTQTQRGRPVNFSICPDFITCSLVALHGGAEQLQRAGDKGAAPPIPLAACLHMQTAPQFRAENRQGKIRI